MKKIQYILCVFIALALTGCYSSTNVMDDPITVTDVRYYQAGNDGYYATAFLDVKCKMVLSNLQLNYELDGKKYTASIVESDSEARLLLEKGATSYAFRLDSKMLQTTGLRKLSSLVADGQNQSANLLNMFSDEKLTFRLPDFQTPVVDVDIQASSAGHGLLQWKLLTDSPLQNLLRYDVYLHVDNTLYPYRQYNNSAILTSVHRSGECEVYAEVVVYIDDKEAITIVTPRYNVEIQ